MSAGGLEMNRKRSKSRINRTLPMMHPNAAAIDVGATIHMAAVRADRAPEPVRSFGTFTTDLHRLVDWFTECGVETVVMESTSVYWIPIFIAVVISDRFHRPRGVGTEPIRQMLWLSTSARRYSRCLERTS